MIKKLTTLAAPSISAQDENLFDIYKKKFAV